MMRSRPELEGKLLIEGAWDWQIVDELTPEPGDLVIRKTRYNGFHRTILEDRLKADDIRYLLFTGVATNVCVESTARSAFFSDFWPVLVEDAMNHSGPDFNRQATLWNFEHVCRRVSSLGVVGVDASLVEDIIGELVVGDDSDPNRFILTSGLENESVEEALDLARNLTGEYVGEVQLVEV